MISPNPRLRAEVTPQRSTRNTNSNLRKTPNMSLSGRKRSTPGEITCNVLQAIDKCARNPPALLQVKKTKKSVARQIPAPESLEAVP